MYPALDEADMQQRPTRDHEDIPLQSVGGALYNRSVSETPERVRVRQIFNKVSTY